MDSVADSSVDIDVDGYTLGFGAGYYDFDFEDNIAGSGGRNDSGAYFSAAVASSVGNIVIQPTFIIYDTDLADLWSLEFNAYWKFEMGN